VHILLDESLPRPLAKLLTGHEARTVSQVGWTSLSNGELLRQAAEKFDALLTADQNIEFQQNLKELPIAVVVLVAATNRIESLEPLVPSLLQVLDALEPKTLVRVGA
jgi:predicted nuclease of predicted toxin-antitoxin system